MIDYSTVLNQKVQAIKPSGIRRFFDIANEMDNVISLSIGEPDFTTPWHVREEGIRSLEDGKTWYSPNRGFIELRQEISRWLKRHYHVNYNDKEEILVTVGGSEAIDLCLRSLMQPGRRGLDSGAVLCVLCAADRNGGRRTGCFGDKG